jgi:hypothetical protein
MKEKLEKLKSEIIEVLKTRDLVGDVIYLQDPLNFPITCEIVYQDEDIIRVEDDSSMIGGDRDFSLDEFPIESLIELL